ncbi:DUF2059 domain-containing protein [Roseateles sp.]|uniref:DUF2059 domain-containing protein n=1 Tax=Roseateles sp. TaxID=1971397 RepID=UPI00286B4590|nr:DUF2059 domain-containing protein [Roseateles sp.]
MNKSMKILATAALAVCVNAGFAQAATPAATPTAAAPSAAKKELIAKLIQLQQPGVENIARMLIQQPVGQLMQGAGQALQTQVPAEKREATAKAIEAEVRKFVDDAVPMVKDKGAKMSSSVWAPMLDEKFSEDELKQIIAWLESPASKKYQQIGAEMQNALGQKLMAEVGPGLDTKFKTLQQSIAKQLGVTPKPAAPAAAPAKK